jgi:hypothetical protein
MRAETLKGHLDGILLAVLEPGPRHGYAIMEALPIRSDGHVDLPFRLDWLHTPANRARLALDDHLSAAEDGWVSILPSR